MIATWILLAAVTAANPKPLAIPPLTSDATLEFRARWEPCRESKYGLFERQSALRNIEPSAPRTKIPASSLNSFFPPEPATVGETWSVDLNAILPFLRSFHPSANVNVGFLGAEEAGTFACLRSRNDRYAELLTRSHALFTIEDGIVYRPAQFEGRIQIDLIERRVVFARFALPDRNPNVDINAPYRPSARPGEPEPRPVMAADIGWVPRMEITYGETPADLTWTESIDLEDARVKLRRRFYRFAELDWKPFEEAVQESLELGKKLHVIIVFGALDDASC